MEDSKIVFISVTFFIDGYF